MLEENKMAQEQKRPKPGFPDKGYRGKREGGSCTIVEPRPGKERPYETWLRVAVQVRAVA